jgi:DNA polymerase I
MKLADSDFSRGDLLALAITPDRSVGLAWSGGCWSGPLVVEQLAELEAQWRPRWTCWSVQPLRTLVEAGLRVATCWELGAVHRLLFGGWRASPELIWAALHDLSPATLPAAGQLNLLGPSGEEGTDPEQPVRPD